MGGGAGSRWESLEAWSPTLFLVGCALELIFAANHGIAFLVDGVSFVDWLYPTVLLGRLAILLGVAGLSVRIADRNPRLGTLGRVVVSLAAVFTTGLLTLSTLAIAGVSTQIIAVFGIGTVVLTVLTYALFGAMIVRTGAFTAPVGGILLVASVAVVGVFVGTRTLPTGLVGAAGEGTMVVLFLALWYALGAGSLATGRAEPAPDATTE